MRIIGTITITDHDLQAAAVWAGALLLAWALYRWGRDLLSWWRGESETVWTYYEQGVAPEVWGDAGPLWASPGALSSIEADRFRAAVAALETPPQHGDRFHFKNGELRKI